MHAQIIHNTHYFFMTSSYLQVKRFIDDQIKILNTPLQVDDQIRAISARHHLSEEKVASLIFKCNLRLKRHYSTVFNKQVVHQIVQQVVKSETEKLFAINERLARIDTLIQPISLPDFHKVGSVRDRVRLVNELVRELPEPRYLFAIQHEAAQRQENAAELTESGKSVEQPSAGSSDSPSGLIRDYEELADSEAVTAELKVQLQSSEALKEQYSALRDKLLKLDDQLAYKLQKADYLESLAKKMALSGVKKEELLDSEEEGTEEAEEEKSELLAQISRFNILVEKLEFVMG